MNRRKELEGLVVEQRRDLHEARRVVRSLSLFVLVLIVSVLGLALRLLMQVAGGPAWVYMALELLFVAAATCVRGRLADSYYRRRFGRAIAAMREPGVDMGEGEGRET